MHGYVPNHKKKMMVMPFEWMGTSMGCMEMRMGMEIGMAIGMGVPSGQDRKGDGKEDGHGAEDVHNMELLMNLRKI